MTVNFVSIMTDNDDKITVKCNEPHVITSQNLTSYKACLSGLIFWILIWLWLGFGVPSGSGINLVRNLGGRGSG